MDFISIKNNQCIRFGEIPVLPYADFYSLIDNKLTTAPDAHCVAYYGVPMDGKIRLICCLADDATHLIDVASAVVEPTAVLESLTPKHLDLQLFEREIHENFGVGFSGHPWLKPVRYPHNASATFGAFCAKARFIAAQAVWFSNLRRRFISRPYWLP